MKIFRALNPTLDSVFIVVSTCLLSLLLLGGDATNKNSNPAFFVFVNAANITPTKATFYPADFEVAAPTVITTHRGEPVVGVPTALACGYADPIGNFTDTKAYFRFNYTTPEEYMYRVGFRSYAPDALSNSIWFFFEENVLKVQGDVNKNLVDIPRTNAAGDWKTSTPLCLHIAGHSTIPNTFTIRPREPGTLIAELWFEMIPQPKILSVTSKCGGDCDADQPIPIRIIFAEFVCAATDFHAAYGSVVIKGPGGEHTCPTLNKQQEELTSGNWYTECVIPTSVTKGEIDELSASVFWPSSPNMPANAKPTKVNVANTPPSLAWIAAPACVVALLLGYLCYIYYKRWKATKNAPKDANNLCTMFVAARGISLLWDKAPETAGEAIRLYNNTVRIAAEKYNCYIARKIHESYLIVAKDPKDLYLAAAQIQLELSQTNWYKILTGKDAPEIKIANLKKIKSHHSKGQQDQNKPGTSTRGSVSSNSRARAYGSRSKASRDGGTIDEDEEGKIELYMESVNSHPGDEDAKFASHGSQDASKVPEVGGNNPFMDNTTKSSLANRVSSNLNQNSSINSQGSGAHRTQSSIFGRSAMGASTNTSVSQVSTSNRTVNVVQNGITCSIAIVIGSGRIQVHEAGTVSEYESYEYSGPAIDEAATLVDLAHPTQTLTTQLIRERVDVDAIDSCNGTFTEVAEKTITGRMVKILQFNPSGCEVFQGGLQEEENVESMQAQLDAAANGFAKKICTVLYLELHGLVSQAIKEEDRKIFHEKYMALFNPIEEIVKHTGGTLVNLTSTNLMIAWNAFSPSPMHVTRAATCIYRLRELFNSTTILKKFKSNHGKVSFCGGMATSAAIVGATDANQTHKQVFGLNWESAQHLARLARPYHRNGSLNCPVLTTWNPRSDLINSAQLQAVDIIVCDESAGIRDDDDDDDENASTANGRSRSSRDGENLDRDKNSGGKVAPPPHVVTKVDPRNLRVLVAVMREATGAGKEDDDNEWMYAIEEQQNNNPYTLANEALICLLNDYIHDAEERWNDSLKEKLEKNEGNEVNELQMVGLKKLAKIMRKGWTEYCESGSILVSEKVL